MCFPQRLEGIKRAITASELAALLAVSPIAIYKMARPEECRVFAWEPQSDSIRARLHSGCAAMNLTASDPLLIVEDQIHFIPNCRAAVGFEVSERALQVGVPHPLLNGAQIDAIP